MRLFPVRACGIRRAQDEPSSLTKLKNGNHSSDNRCSDGGGYSRVTWAWLCSTVSLRERTKAASRSCSGTAMSGSVPRHQRQIPHGSGEKPPDGPHPFRRTHWIRQLSPGWLGGGAPPRCCRWRSRRRRTRRRQRRRTLARGGHHHCGLGGQCVVDPDEDSGGDHRDDQGRLLTKIEVTARSPMRTDHMAHVGTRRQIGDLALSAGQRGLGAPARGHG